MKRAARIITVLTVILAGVFSITSAFAGGSCGTNATWTITGEELIIEGTGAIKDYGVNHNNYHDEYYTSAPWYSWSDHSGGGADFRTITIKEGITSVGANAFYGIFRLSGTMSVSFPSTLLSINSGAFGDTDIRTITFMGDAPDISSDAFEGVTANVYYTPNASWENKISNYGGRLTWIKPNGSCGQSSSWVLDNIDTLRLSGSGAVSNTPWTKYSNSITTLVISSGLNRIDSNILTSLPQLTKIIFEGDMPIGMAADAFAGVSATAYYPHNRVSWTEEVLKNYGGNINWQRYCSHYLSTINPYEAQFQEESQPVSCETDGWVSHWKCSVCGNAFFDEALTRPMTNEDLILHAHSPVIIEGYPATCTETGLTDEIFCEVCGETLQAQEEIPLLPHTYSLSVEKVDATCTSVGYTAEYRCSVCNELLEEIKEIPQLSHTSTITVPAKEPTCTETGYTAEYRCSVCNELLRASEEIATIPHTDIISITALAPTCTEPGHTEEHRCSVCNELLTASEEIAPTGHSYGEPTFSWSEDGHTCTYTFNCVYEDDTLIRAIDAVGSTVEDSNCTEMGTTEYVASVTLDDNTYTETTTRIDIPAKGHTPVDDVAISPTDRNTGLTAGSHCSVCNEILEEQQIIPALWSYTEDGLTVTAYNGSETDLTIPEGVSTLSSTLFKNNTSITSVIIPSTVSTVGTQSFYGATSLTDIWLPDNLDGIGTQTFYNTTAILHANADSQTAKALSLRGKNFTDGNWTLKYRVTSLTSDPTAVYLVKWTGSESSLELPSTFGGAPLTQIQTDAFNGKEQLESIIIPASVTSITDDAFTGCSDNLVIRSSFDAYAKTWAENNSLLWEHYPHSEVIDDAIAATCTENGLTEGKHCSECGEVLLAQETVPATGHTMTATAAKAATCTEAGNSAYWKCTACNKYFSDAEGLAEIEENSWVIPANGHTLTAHSKVEATCTMAGTEAYWDCSVCNKLFSDEECAAEIEEPVAIPAKGHTLTAHSKVDAACTEPGTEAFWSCSVCNKLFSDEEATTEIETPAVIPALGHEWGAPTYTWNADNSKVTATRICAHDAEPSARHPRTQRPRPVKRRAKRLIPAQRSRTQPSRFRRRRLMMSRHWAMSGVHRRTPGTLTTAR